MKKSILIIDDESSVSTLLDISITRHGFQAETALSGSEGIRKARQQRFDLIILDVALPGMDGIEICQALRELEGYAETPIIMISSRADSVTRQKARQAGASEYLVKPFTSETLLRRVEDYMSRPFFS
jgi:two-component system alkaline phosphatase synthesis response regulator PhoP